MIIKKRVLPRKPLAGQLQITTPSYTGRLHMMDVSIRGIGLKGYDSIERLQDGCTVTFHIPSEHKMNEVVAVGKIIDDRYNRSLNYFRYSMLFTQLALSDAALIQNYIDQEISVLKVDRAYLND